MLAFDALQLKAFARASFVARMQEVLALIPGDVPPAREMIEQQLELALGNGLTSERDCARWVLCAWCLGPEFHVKIASVAELLQRRDVGPEYKAMSLELMLTAVLIALAGESRLLP